ncbi:sigma-54 dependent transcriptional regulator [Gallaecimonas kandeliae]|uniref:sigma-54-dependent transcriptional regulator n=1 Tax=Gallaecimonas kandeliae TaxID=3029055 RepID=UPI00264A0475|nr:sigma-54 dependent transcriptional regulator [Gallaecimonas kandeliae]WKE66519.1 sigma-54 dependent transcriptional regulator [Gallaecimonas kandeliae]
MNKTILLVDPRGATDPLFGQLEAAGYRLERALDCATALVSLHQHQPMLVLVDADLDTPLSEFVARVKRSHPKCALVTLVRAHQSVKASEAMRQGAMDYLLKPFNSDQLLAVVNHAFSFFEPIPNMVVASQASRQVLLLAKKAAQTNASILIGGESGTGKERLAQYIHEQSQRAEGPYVAVNCAAIPETMLESTLFGHAKGAFTGAVASQVGKFELANGGTLVLDEISEMPLELQAKLLRVLQERELEKLGSNQKVKLDVRIIAASNKDLRAEVAKGRFREDLFYRLDVLPLAWPALRERQEDILPLARHFLEKYADSSRFELHPDAARALLAHPWPGNVRELENVIQRALILARGLVLQPEDLMLPRSAVPELEPGFGSLRASKKCAEFQHVLDTLRRFNGHRQNTAEALGVTTRALRYKLAAMREQGIDINQLVVTG